MSEKKLPTIEELLTEQSESKTTSNILLSCHHSLVHNAFEWVEEDKYFLNLFAFSLYFEVRKI